jgi:Right handed beta helix region
LQKVRVRATILARPAAIVDTSAMAGGRTHTSRALRRVALLVAVALGLTLGFGLMMSVPPPPDAGSAPAPGCDRYAATTGSNSARGTRRHPFRTPGRLAHALKPGQVGCMRDGTYSFSQLLINRRGITLREFPGAAVTLAGEIKFLPGGRGATIAGMTLDGSSGKNRIGPRIYADRVVLRRNEITNRNTGICVHVGRFHSRAAPQRVRIIGNRIFGCGRLPATNHDHGVYISEGVDTSIVGNWIYSNADRGIQLYPHARKTEVVGNVIHGNGQGISIGGDGPLCSDRNVVRRNVIPGSVLRWNIYSNSVGDSCRRNRVKRNCVYAAGATPPFDRNGGIEHPSRSFSARQNLVANPLFVDLLAGDFNLQPDSPCNRLLAR